MSDKEERVFRIELTENDPRDKASLYLEDVHKMNLALKLKPEEIDTIQQTSSTSCAVMVKTLDIWQVKGIDDYMGSVLTLTSGKKLLLTRAYENLTNIVIKYVPIGWSKQRLFTIFRWYGEVIKVEEEFIRPNRNVPESKIYAGIRNGNYRVQLKLKKSIPSSLSIDKARLEVHYKNQELSCWRCGRAHMKWECRTPWGKAINKFRMEEFEKDPESDSEDDLFNHDTDNEDNNMESETPENLHEENTTPENSQKENNTPQSMQEESTTPESAQENITPENTPEENRTPENTPEENRTPENTPEENIVPENSQKENVEEPKDTQGEIKETTVSTQENINKEYLENLSQLWEAPKENTPKGEQKQ